MFYNISLINQSFIQVATNESVTAGSAFLSILPSLISAVSFIAYIWLLTGGMNSNNKGYFCSIKLKLLLKYLKNKTGRHIILLNHGEDSSLFSNSGMIEGTTMMRLERLFFKFRDKPTDLILNTYGGSVFHAVKIARLLHSKNVRVFVPYYAMSGGTLLALSCNEINLGNNACLGCVDVQLSNFIFDQQSGSNLNYITKKKGTKAGDSTIGNARTANQVTIGMKAFLNEMLDKKFNDDKLKMRFINFLTEGSVEHIRQLGIDELKMLGLNVNLISDNSYAEAINLCRDKTSIIGV